MRNLDRVLADQEWEQSIDPDIMTCDFEYRCGNWQRARRFIGVKVKTDKTDRDATLFSRSEYPEYEYFCFVTNLMTGPLWCYEFYRKRGNCENWIEQVKNHYYAGEIHTQRFQANQILFSLSCLAYNIKQWMTYFTDRRACKEEGKTFRYWFIHTAGRLIHTGRQWYLKMQESYPERERWEWILFRLSRLQP